MRKRAGSPRLCTPERQICRCIQVHSIITSVTCTAHPHAEQTPRLPPELRSNEMPVNGYWVGGMARKRKARDAGKRKQEVPTATLRNKANTDDSSVRIESRDLGEVADVHLPKGLSELDVLSPAPIGACAWRSLSTCTQDLEFLDWSTRRARS